MKYILILLLSTQAHAFSKKPPQQEIPQEVVDEVVEVLRPKALVPRWHKHPRGAEYTKLANEAIEKHMKWNFIAAKDSGEFCEHTFMKQNLWLYLISHIAELESSFKADTTYKENFKDSKGNYVISTGLLQLSQESARGYGCTGATTELLKDPKFNLDCGVRIINRWIERDEYISKYENGKWIGVARYFSTLRTPKVNIIKKNMKEACK